MSADASGIRWATCSPLRASGRRPTSASPAITKLSPLSKCTRHRGGCGAGRGGRLRGRLRAAEPAGGAVRRCCGGARRLRRAAGRCRGAGAARRGGCGDLGRAAAGGVSTARSAPASDRLDRRGRDEAHRGEVDDVARALVDAGVGDLRHRPYVDHDGAGQVVVPAAALATAVLDGRPGQGRDADAEGGQAGDAEHERAQEGRPTPIGVPAPWWTTRRPDIALPGEVPLTPSTIARTSHRSTMAPATAPMTVHTSSETNSAVTTPTAASRLQRQQPVDGERGEPSLELGDRVGQACGGCCWVTAGLLRGS